MEISSGVFKTTDAKLRIDLIPAATSKSAACCALAGGVAITPMLTASSRTIDARSSMWRTVTPPIFLPTLVESMSTMPATGKPREENPL